MPRSLCGSHQLHKCLSAFSTRAGCPGFAVLKGHMASPAPRQQLCGVTMNLYSCAVRCLRSRPSAFCFSAGLRASNFFRSVMASFFLAGLLAASFMRAGVHQRHFPSSAMARCPGCSRENKQTPSSSLLRSLRPMARARLYPSHRRWRLRPAAAPSPSASTGGGSAAAGGPAAAASSSGSMAAGISSSAGCETTLPWSPSIGGGGGTPTCERSEIMPTARAMS